VFLVCIIDGIDFFEIILKNTDSQLFLGVLLCENYSMLRNIILELVRLFAIFLTKIQN